MISFFVILILMISAYLYRKCFLYVLLALFLFLLWFVHVSDAAAGALTGLLEVRDHGVNMNHLSVHTGIQNNSCTTYITSVMFKMFFFNIYLFNCLFVFLFFSTFLSFFLFNSAYINTYLSFYFSMFYSSCFWVT